MRSAGAQWLWSRGGWHCLLSIIHDENNNDNDIDNDDIDNDDIDNDDIDDDDNDNGYNDEDNDNDDEDLHCRWEPTRSSWGSVFLAHNCLRM